MALSRRVAKEILISAVGRIRLLPRLAFSVAICSNPGPDVIDKFKVKFGEPLPGFLFKPGECVVNSTWGGKSRQGKSTPKQFDGLKMVASEVGFDKGTLVGPNMNRAQSFSRPPIAGTKCCRK
jgi:hypothetical protein